VKPIQISFIFYSDKYCYEDDRGQGLWVAARPYTHLPKKTTYKDIIEGYFRFREAEKKMQIERDLKKQAKICP
jgi:hypothetical protein